MSDDRDWIDELYAEGRDEAPPAELDLAIRTAARKHAARPWYRDLRYLTTVATAASFVLAATIVYYAPQDDGIPPVPAPAREARPQADFSTAEQQEPASPAATPATRKAERSEPVLEESAPRPGSAVAPLEPPPPAAVGREARVLDSDAATRSERSPSGSLGLTAERTPERSIADSEEIEAADDPTRQASAAAAAVQLADRCGEPPGTAATRTFAVDALGWYLSVRDGETTAYYRCETDRWVVIDGPVAPTDAQRSEQQQPDPEDDE